MDFEEKEIEEIKNKYALTDEQFEEMFEKCKYISFYNCEEQENPTGVFIGGQPGAGKGGIDVFSEKEFLEKNQHAAVLDVDVYRALYPYTNEILKRYPTIYTNITAESTGKILKRMIAEAISNNYNFIFEGTLKNTEALRTMEQMPKHYNKVVRVMATSDIESLLTAFERNYQQIAVSGYGRFTNVSTHNERYNGVLNTIKAIEESKENIVIEIFKRGADMTSPVKIYNSEISEKKAHEVLVEEREKDRNQFIQERRARLKKLLSELQPKDDFEKQQLENLAKETAWLL